MVTWSPLTSRIAQRLRGRLDIEQFAERTVQVAPATVVPPPPPPIYQEAELRRVTGMDEWFTPAMQMEYLLGTREYGPSLAYQLPRMPMVDGNFALGRRRFETSTERERLVVLERLPTLRGHAFVSSLLGNKYFAHQVLDNMPTALVAGQFGTPTFAAPLESPGRHVSSYRSLLEIETASCWSAITESCWVFHDRFLNDSKLERLQTMRRRLRRRAGAATPERSTSAERVMIVRGDSGARRAPQNETALAEHLSTDGWLIVDHTAMEVDELARTLGAAKVVISVEGSHLTHAICALPAGAAVVVLIPPARFSLLLRNFFDRLGISFGFHIGVPGADGMWTVEIDVVKRIVDRTARAARR